MDLRGLQLVTGGAGFIGSNLVRRLVELGARVRVFDDLSSGHLENLAGLEKSVEFVRGDLRDAAAVRAAAAGAAHVFHLGALASVQASVDDPATTHEINVTGTLNVLLAARAAGVRRVVFSSSASIYGDDPQMPKREDMLPAPLSGYALSKLAGEHYGRIFHGLYGLEFFALRYFNVFGPRQDPASHYAAVIPLFMRAYAAGRQPTIYGDGEQTRDFTFVADIVAANLCCLDAPATAAGGVYNVAYGDGHVAWYGDPQMKFIYWPGQSNLERGTNLNNICDWTDGKKADGTPCVSSSDPTRDYAWNSGSVVMWHQLDVAAGLDATVTR